MTSLAWFELTPGQQGLLWLAVWIAAAGAGAWLVRLVWDHVLLAWARGRPASLARYLLDALRRPVVPVALLAILQLGNRLSLAHRTELTSRPAWGLGQGTLYVATVLAVTVLAYAAARSLLEWHLSRLAAETLATAYGQFVTVFRRLAKFVFLLIALTIIFDHFKIQITGLLATAGIASLAIALAAQETLANTIAGLILMIDRPFKPGDRIELPGGQVGDVIAIGLRSTEILSFDHTVITVPNSQVARSQIINLNAPSSKVKIRSTIGVAYGTDLRKAKAVLLEVMTGHPDVLADPVPAVFFTEFGESALQLLVVCWVADYREKFRILDELNMAIKDRFEAEHIQIPFPQRDVHVHMLDSRGGPPKSN